MTLMQSFWCMLGKHERSRGQARDDGTIFRSICRGCRKPMHRTAKGWVIDADTDNSTKTDR
ncbi:MAG: hypothetical protein V4808_03955 [Pseudomonadota bacterium]